MKKIIKLAEARAIAEVCKNLDPDWVMSDIDLLNSGEGDFMAKDVRVEIALFLMSREVIITRLGVVSNASEIFSKIDRLMKNKPGYCRSLALNETLGYNGRRSRWLIAELNMGLNHLSITSDNPYLKWQTI